MKDTVASVALARSLGTVVLFGGKSLGIVRARSFTSASELEYNGRELIGLLDKSSLYL